MALKYEIDKASHDKLSEDMQKLYIKSDDGFQLDVKGVVSKSVNDEFRNNNIDLTKKLSAFDKVDLSKWDEMKKHEQMIADKKLIDSGDIDTLIAQKINVIESDFTSKLETANNKIAELSDHNNNIVSKYEIQGATNKAFADHKIRSDARSAITAQINSMFKVKDGVAVALEGDKIKAGKDGNLTISEFVSSQPDFMKEPSNGGGGQGNEHGGSQSPDKLPIDKIRDGLASLKK